MARVPWDQVKEWNEAMEEPVSGFLTAEERRRVAEAELAMFADAEGKLN